MEAAADLDTQRVRSPRSVRAWTPWALGFVVLSTAALLLWYGSRDDQDIWQAVQAVDGRLLVFALAMHVCAHLLWVMRYALLARASRIPLSFGSAWAVITAGTFGGAVTPGRIGNVAMQMALLMRRGLSGQGASRLVLADRSADLVWFLIMGIGALVALPPLFGSDASEAQVFALVGTLFLALFVLLLVGLVTAPVRMGQLAQGATNVLWKLVGKPAPDVRSKFEALLQHVRSGLHDLFVRRPAVGGAAFGLTAANWLVEFLGLWAVLRAFGHEVDYVSVFFVGTVLVLISNIPITPGGAGVAELAALALFGPLAPTISLVTVLAWRATTYYYDLSVGGLVASIMLPGRNASLAQGHDNP